MTDQSRFSMSDEAKLAAWNETVRRMKAAEQMVEDLRENVRTLVAERDAAERRAAFAEATIGSLAIEDVRAQLAAPPGVQERVAERLGLTEPEPGSYEDFMRAVDRASAMVTLGLTDEPTRCECAVCEGNIGRCERTATRTVDGRRFCDGCGPGSFERNAMRGASTEDIQAELRRRLADEQEGDNGG